MTRFARSHRSDPDARGREDLVTEAWTPKSAEYLDLTDAPPLMTDLEDQRVKRHRSANRARNHQD
jgi:hypothetical protein